MKSSENTPVRENGVREAEGEGGAEDRDREAEDRDREADKDDERTPVRDCRASSSPSRIPTDRPDDSALENTDDNDFTNVQKGFSRAKPNYK